MKTRGIVMLLAAASLQFTPSAFAGESGRSGLTGNARVDLLFVSAQQPDSSQTPEPMIQNMGAEKKKPLLAAALSLVVPGGGEFYSESYVKSAIFFSAEVAAIAVALAYNSKANSKTDQFQTYADAHWSAVRYAEWIVNHGTADYGPTSPAPTPADYPAIANHDFSTINAWESSTEHSEGFTHLLPKYGEQQYYELIGKYDQFKYGWDTYPHDANGVPVSDNGDYSGMIPQQMLNYAADRGKANDYYYIAGLATGIVVVNHVLSALDAALSATSYNRTIETRVGMRLQNIDGNTSEMVPEFHLSLNF
jgi:hypothetical protein